MSSHIVDKVAFILVEYLEAIEIARQGISIARSSGGTDSRRLIEGIERLRSLRRSMAESVESLAALLDSEKCDEDFLRDIDSLLSYYLIAAYDVEYEVLREASDLIDTAQDLEDLERLRKSVESTLRRIA